MNKKELILGVIALAALVGLLWYGGQVGAPEVDSDSTPSSLSAFITKSRAVVVERVGQPIEGFEPSMYLRAFPGLVASDFEGVEAELGIYYEENGQVLYRETQPQVNTIARAITDSGMKTLLENIAKRLKMDASTEVGVDLLLEAILKIPAYAPPVPGIPQPERPNDSGSRPGTGSGTGGYVCTMDAKLCPDGSAVGRSGPRCEFPKCPGETSAGFRTCPDEWIQNKMPGVYAEGEAREYFIIDGARWEISQFDLAWVKNNCDVEPQPVY